MSCRGETFLFRIEQYSTDADNMLTIAVRDKDKLGADDFLGSVTIQLTELFRGQWVEHEIDEQFVLEDSEGRVRNTHVVADCIACS